MARTSIRPGYQDLTGRRYGAWEVVGYSRPGGSSPFWLCRCATCGHEREIRGSALLGTGRRKVWVTPEGKRWVDPVQGALVVFRSLSPAGQVEFLERAQEEIDA